jgi:hypothetical protein
MGQPGDASEAFARGWGISGNLKRVAPAATHQSIAQPRSVRAHPKVSREIMVLERKLGCAACACGATPR